MSRHYAIKSHQSHYKTVAAGDVKGDDNNSSVDRRSSRSRKRYPAATSELQKVLHKSLERKTFNSAHIPRVTYDENNIKQLEVSNSTEINARIETSKGNSIVYKNLKTALKAVNISNNIKTAVVCLTDTCKTNSVNMKKGSVVDICESAEMECSPKHTKNPAENKTAGMKISGTKSPKTRSPTRRSKLFNLNKNDESLKNEVKCSLEDTSNVNSLGMQDSALDNEMGVKNDSETKEQASNVPKVKCRNSDTSSQMNSPKKKGKKGKELNEEIKDTKHCESSTSLPEITVTPPRDNQKPFQNSPSARRRKKDDSSTVTRSTEESGKVEEKNTHLSKSRTASDSPSPSRKRLSPNKSESAKEQKSGANLDSKRKGKCSESPSPTRKGKSSESISPTRKGKNSESISPTRKGKRCQSQSPTRKGKSSESPSPTRKGKYSESSSPTRKGKSSIIPSPSQKGKSPSKSPHMNTSPNLEVPDKSGDSGRPSKRVRSPNARFKEDIILYPWETVRKSPKKSPTEKSTETKVTDKKEALSDTDNSSTTEYSEPSPIQSAKRPNISNNDLVDENILKQEDQEVLEPKPGCSKTLDVPTARVLDFGVPKIEALDMLLTKATEYKYTGGTEKTQTRELSDLIAKLNNSIECTDNKLNDLFGQVEEPDYVDEEVSYIPDENNGESNDSMDSDKTIVEFASPTSPKSDAKDEKANSLELNVDLNEDDKSKEELLKNNNSDIAIESTSSVCETATNIESNEDVVPCVAQKEDEISESSCDKTIAANTSGDLNTVINDKENTEQCKDSPDEVLPNETTPDETKCNDTSTSSISEENTDDCVDVSPKNIFDLFGLSLKRRIKPDLMPNADTEQFAQKNGLSVQTDLKEVDGSENLVSPLLSQTCEMQMDSGNKQSTDKVDDKGNLQNESENRNKDNSEVIELLDDQVDKIISDDDDCMVISATEPKREVVVLSDDDCEKEVSGGTLSPRKKNKIATIDHSVEPAPLEILSRMEKSVTDKKSAFISEELEKYIEINKDSAVPDSSNSDVIDKDMDSSDFKKPEPPPDIKSQLKNVDPDFDEIDGHIFLSFQHENALNAHLQLEEKIDWLNETNIKKMAQMKLLKERQSDSGSKRVTDIKSRDEQKHSFRGIPMRTLKYQKLLKKELEVLLKISDQTSPEKLLPKSPEKTDDITKIKGWKKKFQNTEEFQEATGLHFSEAGKLHWKTESRLLKNLDPDDVKDIGLDLKKKRRKLVNYSNKRKPGNKNEKQEEDIEYEFDYETAITEKDVYDEDEDKPLPDKLPYKVKYHSQHKYGARKLFVKKMGLDSKDEMILKKLGTQKILTMQEKREGGEGGRRREKQPTLILSKITQSMALAAVSALDKKLINKAKSLSKVEDRKKKLADEKLKAREVKVKEEICDDDERDGGDTSMEAEDDGMPPTSVGEGSGAGGGKGTIHEAPLTRSRRSSLRDSTGTHDVDKSQKKVESQEACNKPGAPRLNGRKRGCRYGCICHLCKFSDSGEERETEVKPPCDKEYCRLGCICDSIDTNTGSLSHCRKPSCMFECKCPPKQPKPDIPKERDRRGKKKRRRGRDSSRKRSSELQDLEGEGDEQLVTTETVDQVEEEGKIEDVEDWEPPSKRRRGPTNTRFANLPRRESTYRLAKNLDAVSRKALSVYESSEMYTEQRMRRRKSEQTAENLIEDDGLMESGDLSHARQALRKSCVDIAAVEATQEMVDMTGPRLNPETGVMEISDDDSDWEQTFSDVLSAARIRGYAGQWRPSRRRRKKRSQDYTHDDEGGKNSTLSTSDIIDLVDSEEDNFTSTLTRARRSNLPSTSGVTHGGSSNKTVAQKLGLAKNKLTDSDSKWKTQMVCLKAKKKSDDSSQDGKSEIKLLEIISNCQWENDRTNMLSKISHIISKDYQPNHVLMWARYVLQFLPRADKPAVIPPELQSKLPNAMYSIRVRVTQCCDDEAQPQTEIKQVVKDTKVDVVDELSKTYDDEKKKLCLKQQKKLIEKIKFAERLRDLIRTEQMKGNEVSKFNVSLDGIEKALKRYKTQLWKAYTGSSNLTLTQLKKAVEVAKKGRHSTQSLDERVSLAVKKLTERQKVASATSTVTTNTISLASSTLSRIEANQGLQVVRNATAAKLDTKSTGFIPFSTLQTSKMVKQLIPLTAAAGAAISTGLMTPSVITTTPNTTPVAQSMLVNSSGNVIQTDPSSGMIGSSILASGTQSEVLLIPLADGVQSKTAQVLSAKVAMVPAQGNIGTPTGTKIVKSIPVSIKGQPNGPVRMQLVSRGNTKLSKPMLNPVLSAYASAPLLKTQSTGAIKPQSQIMLNSIKPVTTGSPVQLGQVRLVSPQMNVVGQPAGITGQPISVVRSPVSMVGQQMNIVGQSVRFTAVSTAPQFLGAVNFANTSANASVGVAKPMVNGNGTSFRPPVTKTTSLLTNKGQMSMYPIRYAYSTGTDPSKCQVRQIIQHGTDSSSVTLIPAVINADGKLTTEPVSLGMTNTSNSVTSMQKVLTLPTGVASSVRSISPKSPVVPSSGAPNTTAISSQSPQIFITPNSFTAKLQTVQHSSGQVFQAVPISVGIVGVPSSAGIVTSADVSLNGLCTTAPSVPPVVMTQKVSPSRVISIKINKDSITNSDSVSTNSEEKTESDKPTKLLEANALKEQKMTEVSDDCKVSVGVEAIGDTNDDINIGESLGMKVEEDKDCVKSLDGDYSEMCDLTACDSDGNGDLESLGSSLRSFSSLGESASIRSVESVDAKSWDNDAKERDVNEKLVTDCGANAEVNELLSVARRAGLELANTLEPLDTPVKKKNETRAQEKIKEVIVMDETIAEDGLTKNKSVNNGEHVEETLVNEDVNELLSAARRAGIDIANTLGPINNPLSGTDATNEVHVIEDGTKEVYSVVEDGEESDSCLLIDECFDAVKKRKFSEMMSPDEGNPSKKVYTVQRLQSSSKGSSHVMQIEDSEESDVDIMSVDTDCDSIQQSATGCEVTLPAAQGSRRKSELRSREAMEDMMVVKGKNGKSMAGNKKRSIAHSHMEQGRRSIAHSHTEQDRRSIAHSHTEQDRRNIAHSHTEQGRRRQMRSLFEHLSKIVVQYNPGLRDQASGNGTSNGIPKQTILKESLKLLQALNQKMDRLKESLDDGKQYNHTLQRQLSKNVDSFIRSGVPPTIIKNFLKSVSTATLSAMKTEQKGKPPVDFNADLEYPKTAAKSPIIYTQETLAQPEYGGAVTVLQPYNVAENSKTLLETKVLKVCKSESSVSSDTQSAASAAQGAAPYDLYIDNPEIYAADVSADVNSQVSVPLSVEEDEHDVEVRSTTGDDALLDDLMDSEQWSVNDADQSEDPV